MTCTLYGNCGSTSRFTPNLPCVVEREPAELDPDSRAALEHICGEMPATVCCTAEQVTQLKTNLHKAETIIGSCPACRKNFFNLFCEFTCSPNQSDFVEVIRTQQSLLGKTVVAEANYSVDPVFAEGLYNSCSEVKFSATNGRAMELIGGGATNYQEFLQYIGDEKPMLGGSPFQMNFDYDSTTAMNISAYPCNDDVYKCACVDCGVSCPELEPLNPPDSCKMWGIQCVSLWLLLGYLACIIILGTVWLNSRRSRTKDALRLRLLVDDEEDDVVGDPLTPVRSVKSLPSYRVNNFLQSWFQKLGYFCARFPLLIITVCTLFVLLSSIGLLGIELLDDPAKLWVGPKSLEAKEKAYFDENFGPFYRTEQIFVINETGPVLQDYDTVEWLFSIEDRVKNLQTNLTHDTLENFCFQPLGFEGGCVVESISSYFGNDLRRLPESRWKPLLNNCLRTPVSCLPKFGQPILPNLVLGNYTNSPLDSRAIVTTWLVNNHEDLVYLERVRRWERAVEMLFKQVEKEASGRGLRFSYSLESSLTRELNKSSNTDVKIIVLSYVFMFLYASFSLGGQWRHDAFIKSKFSLGLEGILIVLLSVVSSIGICASFGVKLTLIITEVIPFLVLAVGVDNIYLLVHYLELVNDLYPQYTIEERISKAVGLIGPSIFLSSTCEVIAIAFAIRVTMPAVHNFAIYSCVAVMINSILQLTAFVSALTLDQYRIVARRIDCFPCIALPEPLMDPDESREMDYVDSQVDHRRFSLLIRNLSPRLFTRGAKFTIVAIFTAWLAISLTLIPKMDMGLDQRFAVPEDSFLVDYYTDIFEHFQAGPPVYFVVSDAKPELRQDQQALCGRFSTCNEYSLVNIIEQERKRPNVSYIESPAASWIDDYFQWLNPDLDCCFETIETHKLCYSDSPGCQKCWKDKEWEFDMTGLPTEEEFSHYLNLWLKAPSSECPLGGEAAYGNAISRRHNKTVKVSDFRTAHVPLKSQMDYINAYAAARRISEYITDKTGFDVFPYSIFYIFFAQYRTIVSTTLSTLGGAFLVIFLISSLLLGSPKTALVTTGVVIAMVANVAGLMVLFGVSLNALSLVNLLICVGFGVEFCIHIARAFTFVHKVNALGLQGISKTERAFNALAGTGGTVFGGIALTKLIGVAVLAFTKSKIFEVYYFRMWLALIFCATLHSLVLLPILLSFAGGGAYVIADVGLVDQFRNLSI